MASFLKSPLLVMTSLFICLLCHVTGVTSSSSDRPLETVDYIIIGVTCAAVAGVLVGVLVFTIKIVWFDNRHQKRSSVAPR
jgi:hypothetical protein